MLRIRLFTAADQELGLRLSRQAGWNQTAADWRRVFDLEPDGGFVAEWDGTPVGTAMTTRFGDVAWLSMVLVDQSMRRRGVGTALVEHALGELDHRGVLTIRLDATSLGQPLYERLGFVEQFRLARCAGVLPPAVPVDGVESAAPSCWEQLAAFDRSVTRTERRRLLLRLLDEQPESARCAWRDGRIAGYLVSRPGAEAVQIGPCCADPNAGERLFRDAWRRLGGQRVYIDVPIGNAPAMRVIEATGLAVQRPFVRMVRGPRVHEDLDRLWASAGPEKG
jgi:GNAT superfamily N-acetyltransferase